MPSIVNGLFAGRTGLASHGVSIAVIGDNIANASTVGFKTSRAEFADIISGGQASGRVVGSGSSINAISTIFEQGTTEFTGRPLDLAIDGNGVFIVGDGQQRFYTRAGNFKLDEDGFIVNQNGLNLLGFPTGGSGSLEALNTSEVSQSNVSTTAITIGGNLDSREPLATLPLPSTNLTTDPAGNAGVSSYTELTNASAFSTVVDVFDSLGAKHTITYFFFKTDDNEYTARGYVTADDVADAPGDSGFPRQIPGEVVMSFTTSGLRTAGNPDQTLSIPWANGSAASSITVNFDPMTQYADEANISNISQDGQGVGTITSLNINEDGSVFAILSNGQTSIIGTVAMANFANPEGLTRIGDQLLEESLDSGEPIIGTPGSGTFGEVVSGSLELSTVDIANEFVKLITVQRGFQANSRIITTINQLLSEIIQIA